MGIIDELRKTEKGKLPYQRNSTTESWKSLLETCTSPPDIHVSPKFFENLKSKKEENRKENQERESRCTNNSNDRLSISNESKESSVHKNSSSDNIYQDNIRIVRKCSVTSPEFGKSRLAIRKYEDELENEARKARLKKQKEFEAIQNKIELEAQLKVQEIERKANFETLLKIQDIELRNESQAAEIVKQHRILKETHEQRKQIHDARIQEAEQVKKKLQLEEIRRKERENKERQDKLSKCVSQLNQLFTKVQSDFNATKYQNFISETAKKSLNLIQSQVSNADAVNRACQQSGTVTAENCEECVKILERAIKAYHVIQKELEKAEKDGKEAEAEKERQAKLQQEQSQAAAAAAAAASIEAPLATSTPVPQASRSQTLITTGDISAQAASRGEQLCVDIEAFRKYTELQEKLKSVEEATAVLSSTAELKKFKFDIQKAVNTSINAISPVSGDHLRDKLKRLLKLLSCQPVEVSGRQIQLNQHPQGPAFCKHLIARMIVKKGDEQVSSKHESAFAIGMVAAGLWTESPSIGEMLLAHFQAQCPYLVPYYIPRQEGQSDADYFKSRGYKYENDVVEKHDKFLKRMSGIMRLYFSIIVSSPPRGNHPHGIEYAWMWLTRVLNIEPEPDITTTMIYDCLQVTGNALCQVYKKQFLKLLHILVKEMLPKLKSVSSDAGSGSLTRLQLLLETSVKHHGSIPPPDGFLEKNFWLS
ncbi:mRNA export factor GLE1-like [Ruditapes philippinarum]|uniref:mRNA export factor GLE1-like n=1 Tax=Ruditapes philippinarum TaxID=129788 RepID=UPI00295B6F39|nr:mRNA export factor GLE1-like [Ruditapes philippinarum]